MAPNRVVPDWYQEMSGRRPELLQFATAAARYGSAVGLVDAFARRIEPYGFHTYVVLELPMFPNEVPIDREQRLTRYDNLPPEWTELYVSKAWWRVDPVAIMSYGRYPFYWRDAYRAFEGSAEAREMIEAAAEHGLVDGFTIPMLDTRSTQMIVSLGSAQPIELESEDRAALVYAATAVGSALQRMRGTPEERPPLTGRQREALQWTAAGKTAWEVGAIMRITEDTVNRHLAAARQTLGASTNAHAVALAIRQGELRA